MHEIPAVSDGHHLGLGWARDREPLFNRSAQVREYGLGISSDLQLDALKWRGPCVISFSA